MTKVLDWSAALETLEGDQDLLYELVEVFFKEASAMMDAIRTAIEDQDPEELRRSAHTLKGAVRVFAAEPATEAAFTLETMGREKQLDGSEKALQQLEKEIDALLDELHRKQDSR